jgi:hypothetical protein
LSFAYLVYAIVLILVVGWSNLGRWEWSGLAGGPVLIYLIRTLTNAYFTFRTDNLESRLKVQSAERAKTIQKLKDATKYDSTQELLEKYGGEKPTPKGGKSRPPGEGKNEAGKNQGNNGGRQNMGPGGPFPARTTGPPPPTANIQLPSSTPSTPQNQHRQGPFPPPQPPHSTSPLPHDVTAEFAPNADDLPLSYAQYQFNPGPPRWYDRILDLMLGEDETAAKNRIILICQKCRLVNGQAPPGTKSLVEVGQWKCMSCGAMNGEMDEGKRIIREVLGQRQDDPVETTEDHGSEASTEVAKGGKTEEEAESAEDAKPRKRVGRSNRNKSQMIP